MDGLSEKLDIKRERITKLLKRTKSDKVPIYLLNDGYLAFYAGRKMNEINSYDEAMAVTKKAFSDLDAECGAPYVPYNVWLNPTFKLWDGAVHRIGDDGVLQIIPSAIEIMRPEEYPDFIVNPAKYLMDVLYPRRYKILGIPDEQIKYEKIAKSYELYGELGEYMAAAERESEVVNISGGLVFNPIDIIFDFLRNFTGIMRDVRKCPEYLKEAGMAMVPQILKAMQYIPKESFRVIETPMHLPAFIKPKDFEKTYWPSFKALSYGLVEQGHNIQYIFEKDYTHLHDYLQELPDKNILGLFEKDDLKTVQKKLGKIMAFGGGLSRELMYSATKAECINHTKKLIDELGAEGNYIIAPEFPMMFGVDAKPENIKAIIDTTKEYGIR